MLNLLLGAKVAVTLWIVGIIALIPWMFGMDDRYAKVVMMLTLLPAGMLAAILFLFALWKGQL